LSIIAFLFALTPDRTHRLISGVLMWVVSACMLTSVFGFGFQCNVPHTWKFVGNVCIHRIRFYTVVEVINTLLDLILAFFPSFIILGLRIDQKRKFITIGFYMILSMRLSNFISIIAAIITQLVVMYTRSEDPFLSWTFALAVQIIQTLSIVTACGPYLKPFLQSINSGMIGNDDIRRRYGRATRDYYNIN
ncbi:uncharacterized protein CC84DRAFT_1053855, partial [Paraphaeosphaeria sporulosa]